MTARCCKMYRARINRRPETGNVRVVGQVQPLDCCPLFLRGQKDYFKDSPVHVKAASKKGRRKRTPGTEPRA